MKFVETKLQGAFLVELEPHRDDRGFFARSFCANEFSKQKLVSEFVQCNISFNEKKGTLRGMHYQKFPHSEAKLVRCTRGAIYDVIIDLRENSPTFKQWVGAELSMDNHLAFYVPENFAHGFLTLQDKSEVFYQMGSFYTPQSAAGIRWNDPAFNLVWPDSIQKISERDQSYPDFKP